MLKQYLLFILLSYGTLVFGQSPGNQAPPQTENKKAPEYLAIGYNKYRVGSNWINFGAGTALATKQGKILSAAGLDYNLSIKESLFKIGFSRVGNISFLGKSDIFLNDLHLAIGKRNETVAYNLSYFGGLSRAYGYSEFDITSVTNNPFNTIGIYGDVSFFYKLYYDIGIGSTAFVNINSEFPVVGFRIDVYFSNAYKGKVNE